MITKEELRKISKDFGLYLDSAEPGVMLSATISGRARFVPCKPHEIEQLITWLNEFEDEKRSG